MKLKWEMEILSPGPPALSYLSSPSWQQENNKKSTKWTPAENKMFEKALAFYDKETPDRWQNVAAMIPGKTVMDVIQKYRELEADVNDIEAGLIPIPGYSYTATSPFTLDYGFDGFKQSFSLGGKRSSTSARPTDHERKKGIPWTEEEHKLFLLGLKKYGKGDWRNISRNFVVTRTATQVASHAQKYFIRQLSGGKDKRRASIHDITTVNLPDTETTPSPEQPAPHTQQRPPESAAIPGKPFCWNQPNSGAAAMAGFNPTRRNVFLYTPNYVTGQYGHNLQGGACDSSVGSQNMIFQMQSSRPYPYG